MDGGVTDVFTDGACLGNPRPGVKENIAFGLPVLLRN